MHIHILGICGTFMGGLAALAREAGHRVTGCDAGVYPPMSDQLRSLGIDLIEGFGAEQLELKPDMWVVGNVVSRARLPDHSPKFPLMEAIMAQGLPYTSGPQWLAEHVLQGRHVLAVAGTHGKTTTTSMLAWILEHAGLQPGFLVGGVPMNFGVSARLGAALGTAATAPDGSNQSLAPSGGSDPRSGGAGGPPISEGPPRGNSAPSGGSDPRSGGAWGPPISEGPPRGNFAPSGGSDPRSGGAWGPCFVIEADEYDTAFFDKRSKFVHYRPRTAILNNLEFDHADIFDDLGAIERQFHHLVRTVPASGFGRGSGCLVVNGQEASLQRVLDKGCWSEVLRFGGSQGDYRASGPANDFAVVVAGQSGGPGSGSSPAAEARVRWSLSGTHNQMNALAAIAAAAHVGVPLAVACEALCSFENVKRRLEVRGTAGGVTVYDDFAHHPTAIRTTVDGLRTMLNQRGDAQARILAVFEPRSNTMKLGSMKSQLPWSLENADLAFCHSAGLDWSASEALAPMGDKARVASNVETLVSMVQAAARPGDQVLCMSNGGFGGVHGRLLAALAHSAP